MRRSIRASVVNICIRTCLNRDHKSVILPPVWWILSQEYLYVICVVSYVLFRMFGFRIKVDHDELSCYVLFGVFETKHESINTKRIMYSLVVEVDTTKPSIKMRIFCCTSYE